MSSKIVNRINYEDEESFFMRIFKRVSVLDNKLYQLVGHMADWIELKHPSLHRWIITFSQYGAYVMLLVVFGSSLVAIVKDRSLQSLYIPLITILGAILARFVNKKLREKMKRQRPYIRHDVASLHHHKKSFSFPSNHAAGAFALTIGMWHQSVLVGVILFCMALCLCFSRMYVKLHYLSDVLAGGLMGILLTMGIWLLMQYGVYPLLHI